MNWLPLIQKSLTVSLIWEFLGRFLCTTNLFFKLSTGSRPEYLFFSFQIASEILLNICNMLGPSKWFARVCSFRHPEIPLTAKSIHDCIYRIRSAFVTNLKSKSRYKLSLSFFSHFKTFQTYEYSQFICNKMQCLSFALTERFLNPTASDMQVEYRNLKLNWIWKPTGSYQYTNPFNKKL